MNAPDLARIKQWLPSFVAGFASPDGSLHNTHIVKQEHSLRVASHCVAIATDLGWDPGRIASAEALGLLHDVGRFPQFHRYGTLRDGKSVDHGELGREVLAESSLLEPLDPAEREAILCGVCHHNRLNLPDCAGPEAMAFLMLIRDADKLDIIQIICELIATGSHRRHPELLLDIDIDGPVNPSLIEDLTLRRSSSYTKVHSLADTQLMHVSWIYDLNYAPSCGRFAAMGLMSEIRRTVPGSTEIGRVLAMAESELAARAASPRGAATLHSKASKPRGKRCPCDRSK